MKGDELDDAIDAVVREIMRTEPPAGLRARVMGQLSRPERRVFLTVPRLAAAAAFAVCLVVGLVVTRDGTSRSAEPTRTVDVAGAVARATEAVRPAPEPPKSAAPRVIGESRSGRRLTTTPPDDERVVSAMSLDEPAPAVAIAPLRPMPATTADPIESSPVLIQAIAIHPLAMEPVRVDLLPSPPR